MKSLVFDAGPVISLTTNNLLWLLPGLRQKFGGDFCIAPAVKRELVDRPFVTKKFKFEAIQVEQQIEAGILKVLQHEEISRLGERLQSLANNVFCTKLATVPIVQRGEMESLAAVDLIEADGFVTDERITRMLVEAPDALKSLLEKRLHTKIKVNESALNDFLHSVRHINIIRSFELVTIAYERGLLDKFVVKLPQPRKELLESVLWGVKLNGCAVSEKEIDTIVDFEMKINARKV